MPVSEGCRWLFIIPWACCSTHSFARLSPELNGGPVLADAVRSARDDRIVTMILLVTVAAGLSISSNQLETHYLARGNVPRVVNALIAADRAAIELPFKTAAAIDLAGRDGQHGRLHARDVEQRGIDIHQLGRPFILSSPEFFRQSRS